MTIFSPFTTEPSTTNPFYFVDFQCFVGQIGIYANPINYSYENYIQEMNGQYGVNTNMTHGISLLDYNNNYRYICVNLDRKLPETENVSQSLSLRGTVKSLKDIIFHCYIDRIKTIVINVESGAQIA